MISLHENILADKIALFRRWFDSTYYHKLYSHRSDEEALLFLDELIHYLQPDTITNVFGDYGLDEFEKDRSPRLIMVARKRDFS